jgi:hypothetical protein
LRFGYQLVGLGVVALTFQHVDFPIEAVFVGEDV